MTERFAAIFKTKTREQWEAIFAGKDACVVPVLELDEVAKHPHHAARGTIITIEDVPQPAPAPRLSRTPGRAAAAQGRQGANTAEILTGLGYSREEIQGFFKNKVAE